jgi:hypothetical protein
LNGQHADQLKTKTIFTSYLKVYLTFLLLTSTTFTFATAEHLIGCLLTDDVCEQNETCYDDFAFGRCLTPSDFENENFLYQYPTYSPGAETLLEEEMTKLYNEGYIWKDDYTQCILQTALAAIKYQIEYDPGLCNAINEDDDLQNDEETIEDEKTNQTPENYLIMTDPILLNTEEKTDPEQFYYVEDDNEDDTPDTYLEITKKNIPELLDISTRDLEEPYELTGIENLPIQLTKFYQPRPASNYEATDYNDEELDDYIDPKLFDYASDDDENIFNDQEENSNDDEIGISCFSYQLFH